MIIIVVLILSIVLQIVAFVIAIRLIRVSRRKLAWVLLAFAFLFMGIYRGLDLIPWLGLEKLVSVHPNIPYFISIIISILIALGVVFLSQFLHSLKRTSQFQRAAEKRFRVLFNSTSDFIAVLDHDGNFVEVNENTCDVLGFTKTELLTRRLNDILSSRYLNILDRVVDKIADPGRLIIEAEYKAKNGMIIPVEISTRKIELGGEKCIVFVGRDITERKELQKKILKTIIDTEEKERKRFAKDLHDGLGPLLSTIKLYINELESEDVEEKEKKDYIKYTSELIDEAVTSTRNISNNITPNVISNYGLVKSVESFVNKINKMQQISISFKTINIDSRFDETLELILYRILTELINNTLKHASAAHVLIVLELLSQKLILTYKDDGIGFDLRQVLQSDKGGMGLRNIFSRIESINGAIEFEEGIDKGTEVSIKLDVEPAR
jgi:PAS domain S-box-containing protein